MQNFINSFLKIIKYPVAIFCVLAFYPMSIALVQMIFKTFTMDILLYFLFPIVGKLRDLKTYIDGNLYSMNQHGFLRDREFELESIFTVCRNKC